MDLSSWFRRTLLRNSENAKNPDVPKRAHPQNEQEEEELLGLGITQQLIDHVKSFTLDTFKDFPLSDEEGADNASTTSTNIQKDLSEWQERHATLVLSKLKELSHLRFKLCPRYLKERQFWRVYFMLVKKQVAEYELRAIQVARLKEMAVESENSATSSACEVEMAEAKLGASLAPSTP